MLKLVRKFISAGETLALSHAAGDRAVVLLTGEIDGIKVNDTIEIGPQQSLALRATADSMVTLWVLR